MGRPRALICIRCGAEHALDAYDRACAGCARAGVAANLTVSYEDEAAPSRETLGGGKAMWRFDAMLPVAREAAVTLGEGGTPLLEAEALGIGRVLIKDESQNPTWSFKDRLASSAVSIAKARGARVIVSSSSGNAGASAAAYAARAALDCVVFTFEHAAGPMLTQMRSYGAKVLSLPRAGDRWTVQTAAVKRFGWFSTSPFFGPAIGSNPYGIEGYKTIAYEIAEAMEWAVPDWCVLPVCYGDALYGMWKGFDEMRRWGWTTRTPRLAAAEVSGSFAAALAHGEEMPPERLRNEATIATSLGASRGTFQGADALRRADGAAVMVENEEMRRWQRRLAERTGIFAEPASVAPFAAIERLRADGTMKAGESAVALLTATGLKDTAAAESWMEPVPKSSPDLEAALRVLRERYGFHG